jgi:hypothetical protein
MESLELFGREVLPEFKDRDAAAERAKAERLAPVLEQVLWRKPATDHPPLPTPDYAFPAIPRGIADRTGADEFHRFLDRVAGDTATGDTSVLDNWREGKSNSPI